MLVSVSAFGQNWKTANLYVKNNAYIDSSLTVERNFYMSGDTIFFAGDTILNLGSGSLWFDYAKSGGAHMITDTAAGLYAVAGGFGSSARGDYSTAFGTGSTAEAKWSTAIGNACDAVGTISFAIQGNTKAIGGNSFSSGHRTIAIGIRSMALNSETRTSGTATIAAGVSTISNSLAEFVCGLYNDTTNSTNATGLTVTDNLFVVGNGTSDVARSNAFVVYKNGNMEAQNFRYTASCDTIASAAIIAPDAQNIVITGTASIDSIQTTNIPNFAIIYIEFTGTAATTGMVDGNNLKLAGNFAYTPDDIMVLQRRGIYFHEISRSIN